MLKSLFLSSFLCFFLMNCSQKSSISKQVLTTQQDSLKAYYKSYDLSPIGNVNDFEGVFSQEEIDELTKIMVNFERKTTNQFCVVTLDDRHVEQEKFLDFALFLSKKWGIGKREKNNGVTIVFSKKFKQIRILNGYGIEKIINDEKTKGIIDEFAIPKFREENYFLGIKNPMLKMMELL
jgi:uncharacterized protein